MIADRWRGSGHHMSIATYMHFASAAKRPGAEPGLSALRALTPQFHLILLTIIIPFEFRSDHNQSKDSS